MKVVWPAVRKNYGSSIGRTCFDVANAEDISFLELLSPIMSFPATPRKISGSRSPLLPRSFDDPAVLAALSSDGQIYVMQDGGSEARVESWSVGQLRDLTQGKTKNAAKRAKKKTSAEFSVGDETAAWKTRIVRHLLVERWRCRDCSHEAEVVYFLWQERRCPECWSLDLEIAESHLKPARPDRFGNIGEVSPSIQSLSMKTTDHLWGASPEEDAKALFERMASYRSAPNGHSYLYALLLFARTLVPLPTIPDPDRFNLVLNVGNVAQNYFRLTGSSEAARTMLDCFEQAAALDSDPVPVSLAKHSFGMAIIYLLDVYTEAHAELITERPGLRQTSIANLREALRLVEENLDRSPKAAAIQRGRIRYALADLLRRGIATKSEQAEAIDILEQLTENEMGRLYIAVRAARAQARLATDLPEEETEEAYRPYVDAFNELYDLTFGVNTTTDAFKLRARELRDLVRFSRRPAVTLSACSTALTADSRSNTWHGLPGSMLEAGARCVIGTRWTVEDSAARDYMAEFYRQSLSGDKSPLQCFFAMQDQARNHEPMENWACFGYLGLP